MDSVLGLDATELDRPLWIVPERDLPAEDVLRRELAVSSLIASVLVRRGYKDPSEAERFLNPTLDHMHDPRLLPDYEPAVKAILGAKERGETIYVHGDYDVDGVTSAALFTRFLQKIGCEVVPHVPHRIREGYGIHLDAVQWAKDQGAKLFLTCDCGISAHEQVRAAKEGGMTVVVTDHHLVGETLPDAVAIVNPHRSDSIYPWPELCGVGVALKLCAGLTSELGHKPEHFYNAYLDLAVMGTVADVMPLQGENRVITRLGLERLKVTKKPGLRSLLRVCNLDKADRLTARNIGFQLGPRVNAVGRIDDSAVALDLLLAEDPLEADTIAQRMDLINTERKTEQNRSVIEAIERVEAEGLNKCFSILLADASWHPGVIGLVAGRLVERFRRPAFVLTIQDGIAKGSARSIPGFHLGEAIDATRHIHLGGGGHEMAAGFSVREEKISELTACLEAFARERLKPEDFRPRLEVDVEVAAEEAKPAQAAELRLLEPFGAGNPEPLFSCKNVKLSSVIPTSNPEHVRVMLQTDDGDRAAMGFGNGLALAEISPDQSLDIVFTLDENTFNGRTSYRWVIIDAQSASS